ncbi:MAG TPA: ABC transporter substrate-binding protein [Methanosarcinaceae archaeon]|nr:ABC transporter substrate-binding protein [Methanosarcinaceae archaeon]
MKINKNKVMIMKTFVSIGITIMLLLCCTLPAAASDYTLGIFGNANEDDTIDVHDVKYTELIILNDKGKTELADARYDDKIDILDVIQVELIILEKENQLTLKDSLDRIVTVNTPVERVIALGNYRTEGVKIIGASDKIVGIDSALKSSPHYFSELLDLPQVGSWMKPDHEAIISLTPDIVITSANSKRIVELEEKLKPAGITVIGLDFYRTDLVKSEVRKLGYVLDKRDEAATYIDWREGYEDQINNFVSSLPEDDKPLVFMEWGSKEPASTYGGGSSGDTLCNVAGGRNICGELPQYPKVDYEWILNENPDVIIKYVSLGDNWGWNDTEESIGLISDVVGNRPGWDGITAVKNNRFYVISSEISWGCDDMSAIAYMTKWFHPELDIDPENIYREYLEQFMGVQYPEELMFAYPPLKEI